jgi:hypothetical protein
MRTNKEIILRELTNGKTVDEMGAIFDYGVWKLENVIHVLRMDGHKIDVSKNSKNVNQYRMISRDASVSS